MIRDVKLTRRAARAIEEKVAWWRVNRPEAPDLLETEIGAAVALIAEQPLIGAPVFTARFKNVRRVLLQRTAITSIID